MSAIELKPFRVVTVDDHAMVREGIAAFLASDARIDVVGQAESATTALNLIKQEKPDIVLMDLKLGHDSGIELTTQITQSQPQIKVIVLTSYHDDEFVIPAFNAGALSYLTKDIAPQELISAIIKAGEGQATLSPVVATKVLNLSINQPKSPFGELSQRETEILKCVAKGLNNDEISEALFISIKTVKTHVSAILSKLHLRDRTQAAISAWKHGLMEK